MIEEVKNAASWKYVISDLNNEEIVGTLYEKELKKTSQTEFRVEKNDYKKTIDCVLNRRVITVHSPAGLI